MWGPEIFDHLTLNRGWRTLSRRSSLGWPSIRAKATQEYSYHKRVVILTAEYGQRPGAKAAQKGCATRPGSKKGERDRERSEEEAPLSSQKLFSMMFGLVVLASPLF